MNDSYRDDEPLPPLLPLPRKADDTPPPSIDVRFRQAVALIRDHGVIGLSGVVGECAGAVAFHQAAARPLRMLIVGPPACGKTLLSGAVITALAAEDRLVMTTLSGLTPPGWAGLNLSTVLEGTHRPALLAEGLHDIVIDQSMGGNTLNHVRSLQADFAATIRRLDVSITTAAFPNLRVGVDEVIGPDALMGVGVIPDLARAFTMIVRIPGYGDVEAEAIVMGRLTTLGAILGVSTGYHIRWTGAARRAVFAALHSMDNDVGTAINVVVAAIRDALVNGMAMGVPPGGVITVAPDHVRAPVMPTPTWDDIERGRDTGR